MIDGAGRLRTLIGVVLPVALPGVATTAILSFLLAWDEVAVSGQLVVVGWSDDRTKKLRLRRSTDRRQVQGHLSPRRAAPGGPMGWSYRSGAPHVAKDGRLSGYSLSRAASRVLAPSASYENARAGFLTIIVWIWSSVMPRSLSRGTKLTITLS